MKSVSIPLVSLARVDANDIRSFASALKPVTFVEGAAAQLGDAIPYQHRSNADSENDHGLEG